jgi:acyl dehydratase
VRIAADLAGRAFGPHDEVIDARWLMAYAAALGDTDPEYLDTRRPGGIVGHPLFPVCYEWPLAVAVREATIDPDVLPRGVHATHDLRIHRRARPGDRLRTRARIVRVEARPPGTYLLWRFETVDEAGAPVSTTDYGSLFLGVACDAPPPPAAAGGAARAPGPAAATPRAARWTAALPIAATAAHTYTECARIWNPIHTDRAVAEAAGLPDIILHGTATLALAVSEVLRREGLGAAAPVARITCRFGGMVRLPSTLEVRGLAPVPADAAEGRGAVIAFEARGADGRPAVRDGRVWLAG